MRLEFRKTRGGVEYTMPLALGGKHTGWEVVSTAISGSAGWIRTNDRSVNSRLLYR